MLKKIKTDHLKLRITCCLSIGFINLIKTFLYCFYEKIHKIKEGILGKLIVFAIIFMTIATIAELFIIVHAFLIGANFGQILFNIILLFVFISLIKTLINIRKTK